MYNHITLIGNLTRDVELKYTPSGIAVTTFGIAVNRRTKDADGNRECDFFNVTCWRQLAEIASQYLSKGSKVAIGGRMQSRKYVGQDGIQRTVWEVQVDTLEMLTPRQQESDPMAAAVSQQRQAAAGPVSTYDDFADPFPEA